MKDNITYFVAKKDTIDQYFKPFVEKLRNKTIHCSIIIFFEHMGMSLAYISTSSPTWEITYYEPQGAPHYVKFRVIDIFTHCTQPTVKQKLLEQFTLPSSPLQVVIITIAFGMGIDCPNIHEVIHWALLRILKCTCKKVGEREEMEHQLRLF